MDGEHVTFCRICEPLCGMVATVEDGRVAKLRPDPDHPLSAGFACPKGIAMAEVQNDPDRVLHPLRRTAGGGHERVSWEEALGDIGERLRTVRDTHGPESIGWYMGNPGAFGAAHAIWVKGFLDALDSPHYYTASSQDVANRFAASAMLYGSPVTVPFPDLNRTDLLVMIGANPLVSHGSVLSAPRIKDQLNAIVERGGRVVAVDPRRTETARAFEHVAVRPDSDAWMLLSLLNVIFDEGLEDRAAIAEQATSDAGLRALAAHHPPEETGARTGIAPEDLRSLARAIAGSPAAAVYGRTGSCLGRHGTLVAALIDAVNLVTGNLDRPGGSVFGSPPVAFEDLVEQAGLATYGVRHSRLGDFPDVLGAMPAALMAKEMTTPGEGRLRAFFCSAGNPVLSCPNGEELEAALGELELFVSLDIYVNETNRHADYVLPATTFLERFDVPLALMSFFTTPFIQATEPVIAPAGEAREEWEVIEDLGRELGVVPASLEALRLIGRTGLRLTPRRLIDLLLRAGPKGDLFGLRRGGLSLGRLLEEPHGIVLADHIATGVLTSKLRHGRDGVRLDHPDLIAEGRRLARAEDGPEDLPLRLIGRRELRSHNSWMHNAPLLMRGDRRHAALVNPADAERSGLAGGDRGRIASAHGSVEIEIEVTEDVMEGTVAVPHGWGHAGGWRTANEAGGVNVNALASSEPEDLERLAGMAFLNGIPVRLEAVERTEPAETSRGAEAVPAGA